MVRYYNELTRLEMEQVDKDETVVMIPVGALEQHGNQCPLGTDEIIAEGNCETDQRGLRPGDPGLSDADLSADPGGTQHGTHQFLRLRDIETGHILPRFV